VTNGHHICPVLGAAAVALDADVRGVRHHVRVGHQEAVAHDEAGAGGLALGVRLPGLEEVGARGDGEDLRARFLRRRQV